MSLNNKHAVVTGGGSGVGAAIALKLASDNVKVTILGRRDKFLIETANKHKNIRATLCYSAKSAKLSREHNNANVIAITNSKVGIDQVTLIIHIISASSFPPK